MSAEAGGITSLSDRELLIRIDTRLEGVIEDKRDHENRIRTIEVTLQKVEDVADKAVTQEQLKPVEDAAAHAVTPKLLWAGALSAVGAATALIQLVDWMFRR